MDGPAPFAGVTARNSGNGIVARVAPVRRSTVSVSLRLRPGQATVDLLMQAALWAEKGYLVELTGYDPQADHDPGRFKIGTVGEPT